MVSRSRGGVSARALPTPREAILERRLVGGRRVVLTVTEFPIWGACRDQVIPYPLDQRFP
jgi:hypothetical protein